MRRGTWLGVALKQEDRAYLLLWQSSLDKGEGEMKLTKKQLVVFHAAKKQLEKEKWFKGVCIDDFPSDFEIDTDFDGAMQTVILTTEYWDRVN